MTITPITINDLTTANLDGTGVFDVLMRANKEHLDQEFNKNRIRGPEYSQVYLGSLTQILQTAVAFLLGKDKTALEAQLLEKQIELAEVEKQKALAELELLQQQLPKIAAEIALLEAQLPKLAAETALLEGQLPKLTAETELLQGQLPKLSAETLLLQAEIPKLEAEIDLLQGQLPKLTAETALVEAQLPKLVAETGLLGVQTTLVTRQSDNEILQGNVLVAQECKLRVEFDVLTEQKLKTAQESLLLAQKVATERAQVSSVGVDDNSVIGKQKALYTAQTGGFQRDAEQKAAKILIDTWNARRMTDEAEPASAENGLYNPNIKRAVDKLLGGVGA